ncbi:MAG: (d)CMP kinase [Clostridiaceae bacterium]|jgi:cytidylate kinase|nr:(d)CMP kinase [Oscillospiraceae bacterium]NLO61995.1 (d)CMP kinase [Clostridiaceae bacterium]
MENFQIAIDGPSGSGKSTLARSVARALGILYLDTGAMYRACGLKALDLGILPKDEKAVGKMIPNLSLDILFENGSQRVILDGEDVTNRIRMPGVSVAASDISGHRPVRERMVQMQRDIAGKQNVVLDGRDIGSFVLPNAQYKFFLTADAEERARRRLEEMAVRGITGQTFEEVLSDIRYRDRQDSTRAFAPLIKTPDAIVIDTTYNSPEETLAILLSYLPDEIRCSRSPESPQ